jgi:hypothetical protein
MNENPPPIEEPVPEDRDEQTPGASSEPEWLRDLSGDEDAPDWLRRMFDDDGGASRDTSLDTLADAPSSEASTGEPAVPPASEERESEPSPEDAPSSPRVQSDPDRPSTDDLRQWFRSTDGEPGPPADKEDLPEWLQALDATEEEPEASTAAAPPAPEEPTAVERASDLPPAPPAADAGDDDEIPDWLRELDEVSDRAEPIEPAPEPSSPQALPGEAPMPDWLASLEEASPEAEDAGASEAEADRSPAPLAADAEAGDLPDWLKEMTEEVAGSSPETDQEVLEELGAPAEVSALEERAAEEPTALVEAEAHEEAVEQGAEPAPLPDLELEPEPVQAETPMTDDVASAEVEAAAEVEPAAPETRIEEADQEPQGPDLWLAERDQTLSDESSVLEEEDELPDWLVEAEQEPEPEESVLGLLGEEPLAAAETPDWMQDLQAEREGEESAPPGQPPAEDELEVETSGPLAGLSGLLSPQLVAGMPVRSEYKPASAPPPEHPVLAERVREMLSEPPTRPELPVVPSSRAVMRALGRWLIYLALIAVIVAGMFVSALQEFVVAPDTSAGHDFYATVGALPAGGEVLLVVDYDAAHDGELTPLTRVLLWHLVNSDQRVVVVSHTPQGGALVQDLLDSRTLWANGMAPQVGEQVLNLGYLPPHPTSMQAFLADPVGGAAMWGQAGRAADTALGQEIAGFGDLDLIVLVSASQEHTRWWIEQLASAQVGSSPILAGVSASVAPTLLPYYSQPAGSRLAGMLVGLAGAAEYEGLSDARFSPNARQNMILQGSAQMLLAAIVLVSGISLLVRGALAGKGRGPA